MIELDSFEQLCLYVQSTDADIILKNCLLEQVRRTNSGISEFMTVSELKAVFDNDQYRSADINSDFLEKCIQDIKKNLDRYIWVYGTLLEDEISRKTYLNLLISRITADAKYLRSSFEDEPHYFHSYIFEYTSDEVYVDCGAYIGDTIIEFAAACPLFRKIYAYEAIPQIYESCLKNVSKLSEVSDIDIREKAIYSQCCELQFEYGSVGDSKTTATGNITVQAINLDEDISEKITFIKMDIEGSEKPALEGAKRHIQQDSPKLAICIYHLADDLWKIPALIYEMNCEYRFLIKHHGNHQFYDTVLYCVPKRTSIGQASSGLSSLQQLDRYRALHQYLVYNSQEERQNNMNCADSKLWLVGQLGSHVKELANQNAVIQEQRSYANQLIDTIANQAAIIEELKTWTTQLTEAKEYHIGQSARFEQLSQRLSGENESLKAAQERENENCHAEQQRLIEENRNLRFLLNEEKIKPWYKKILKERGK